MKGLNLTQTDLDALKLAVEIARKSDPKRCQQIDSKLADEAWIDVAAFASYDCQCNSLSLLPWMWPPVWVDDLEASLREPEDGKGIGRAAKLLRRMLELGISRYHPDPLRAISEAEAKLLTPAK